MGRMSRIHGRSPCDWTLKFETEYPGFIFGVNSVPGVTRYILGLRLTYDQANELLTSSGAYWSGGRGQLVTSAVSWDSGHTVQIDGIEVTAAEADAIRHGASPLDVLLGGWPDGYRITVVPDPLTEG